MTELFISAFVTLFEVRLETHSIIGVEGVEGVGTDKGMDVNCHATTPMQSRSRTSPSRILVLMVAGFTSRTVATSA